MKLRKNLLLFAITVAPFLAHISLRADTIAEYIGGTGVNGGTDYTGQSFTTIAGGAFNNIAFNFFSQSTTSFTEIPFALGSGFLFSTPYTGPAGDLSSMAATSPGFLGQANAVGGFYTFDPSVTLFGGTQYYFYTGLIGVDTITGGGVYGGGTGYVASGGFPSLPFSGGVAPRNFRVTGSPIPEPSTYIYTVLAAGLLAQRLIGTRKKPQHKS